MSAEKPSNLTHGLLKHKTHYIVLMKGTVIDSRQSLFKSIKEPYLQRGKEKIGDLVCKIQTDGCPVKKVQTLIFCLSKISRFLEQKWRKQLP